MRFLSYLSEIWMIINKIPVNHIITNRKRTEGEGGYE